MEMISASKYQNPWPQIAGLQEGFGVQCARDRKERTGSQIGTTKPSKPGQNRETRFAHPSV